MNDLATAISILNATLTAGGEYRYHDEGTQSDWLVSASDLARLVGECGGDYSLWCADTDAVEIAATLADAITLAKSRLDAACENSRRLLAGRSPAHWLCRQAGDEVVAARRALLAHSAAL